MLEKQSIAIHEAGHAVLAFYYRMTLIHVRLKNQLTDKGLQSGHVQYESDMELRQFVTVRGTDMYRVRTRKELTREYHFKDSVIAVGGCMAVSLRNCELLLRGDCPLPNGGVGGDKAFLDSICQDLRLTNQQAEAWILRAVKKAHQLLSRRMDQVQHLADVLLEREFISGDEVREAILRLKGTRACDHRKAA
jgi:shikimate kinase